MPLTLGDFLKGLHHYLVADIDQLRHDAGEVCRCGMGVQIGLGLPEFDKAEFVAVGFVLKQLVGHAALFLTGGGDQLGAQLLKALSLTGFDLEAGKYGKLGFSFRKG